MFNAAKIRAPVHLYSGNEAQMIEIFRDVKPEDWVMCSWRSHYQCLLKGVPRDQVKAEILAGRSISLCFPEYRVVSSAIVGGILPIAVGMALGIKRRGEHGAGALFHGRYDRRNRHGLTNASSIPTTTSCPSGSSSRTTANPSAPTRAKPGTSRC